VRQATDAAVRTAENKGVEILPFPVPGQPFPFTITDVNGEKLKSLDLRGKIVLIDCWATWCTPCLSQIPKLKVLYDEYHARGLEIIGVSFDQDGEAARNAYKRMDVAWKLVLVPSDDDVRELWRAANGVAALPRLFLLDRDGILLADLPLDGDTMPTEARLEQRLKSLFSHTR